MSQTILIEDIEFKDTITSFLTSHLVTNVICLKNADEAIELLKILPVFPLVISRVRMGAEETALKLYEYLHEENHHASLIVLGDHAELREKVQCLQDPITWEELLSVMGQKLNRKVQDDGAEFHPAPLSFIENLLETPCDIYIRIKKTDFEFQYVKLINCNEAIDSERLKKYRNQNLKEIYITSDNLNYFLTSLSNRIVRKLEDTELDLQGKIMTLANGHEVVKEMARGSKLTQHSIDISEASLLSMKDTIEDQSYIFEVLTCILSSDINLAYQICHLGVLLSHFIGSRQAWYNSEHLDVISFASFFSDIALESHGELLAFGRGEILTHFTEAQRTRILTHTQRAVEMTKNHPEFTDFIRTVMLQKSGTLWGDGHEDNPGEELHPLVKVFIIADAFVKLLLNPRMSSSKKELLPILAERYKNPSYQEIIKILEQKFI